MNKSVLALGIILFTMGFIMYYIGQDNYEKAQINYEYAKTLGGLFGSNPSSAKATMDFWGGFTTIGFLLFIFGIPIAIIGAVISEKKDITFQKPIRYFPEKQQNYNPPQPVQQPVKELFCPNCGTKLDGFSTFCYKCGYKLR
jgi:hypothetical protein